jgi:glycolate oxidase iron-sulfur subunit
MDGLVRESGGAPAWARHLDECVGCLACQARCPAGVPFGAMLDTAGERLARARGGPDTLGRWALSALISRPARLRRLRRPLALLQALGLTRLPLLLGLQKLPGLGWLRGLKWLPRSGRFPAPPAPRETGEWLYFPGCVGGLLFPGEEAATLRLLDHAGGYRLPEEWTCCGAVHRHLGDLAGSRDLARRNIAALGPVLNSGTRLVTQAAGCGAALKDYGEWLADDPEWAERAREFSVAVLDLSEALDPELFANAALPEPRRVAYDDPCHAVHAQGISAGPRTLLDKVGNLERVELPHADRCCGAGGSYFLRQPELSAELIGNRRADIEASGAEVLATANPGCRLQWETALREWGMDVKVLHPAELMAEALYAGTELPGDG